ncbi:MAG TPA: prepilin-type N-terminal cleavage/methylation domain-containing protein [Vicinamibacterales bacterium]|nr:prepilin-type N-terminal cleavage/methylation domain-containing protein [Vicinamibacterales bacterium]
MAVSVSTDRSAGFTLVEVLVAMLIIMVMALGTAQLFAVSIRATHAARNQTATTALASQKLEQLRALTWGFDAAGSGLPVTDTTTNLSQDPPTNAGAGLNPSPPGTLNQNTAGYVDFLDARGLWVGTGTQPPATAMFIRRWSIEPLPTNPNNTLVLQVLVTTVARDLEMAAATGPRERWADDALVVSVKTRKAQ